MVQYLFNVTYDAHFALALEEYQWIRIINLLKQSRPVFSKLFFRNIELLESLDQELGKHVPNGNATPFPTEMAGAMT
jgi:hypothetical protein